MLLEQQNLAQRQQHLEGMQAHMQRFMNTAAESAQRANDIAQQKESIRLLCNSNQALHEQYTASQLAIQAMRQEGSALAQDRDHVFLQAQHAQTVASGLHAENIQLRGQVDSLTKSLDEAAQREQ